MSCSLTVDAVRERRKTVTRRAVGTWANIKPGDQLTLVEKAMGLRKGDKQVVLDVVTIVDVRLEPLHLMTAEDDYGWAEVAAEGFPDMGPHEFALFWLDSHGVKVESQRDFMRVLVRRIEWRYSDAR
jgi:hypothetical protein